MASPLPPTPMDRWGRDHWSTFGYIATRIAKHGGVPAREHMRTDPCLHPGMGADDPVTLTAVDGKPYPTRLREGTLSPHDDWSCLDDAEAAGLLENTGTGLHRRYRLTELGTEVAVALHRHELTQKSFATFTFARPNAAPPVGEVAETTCAAEEAPR